MAAPLFLNCDAEYDWLIALRFGLVDDGLAPERREIVVPDRFCFVREPEGETIAGFTVLGVAEFDVDVPAAASLWEPPRFDVPMLGLRDACAGEILLAARSFFGAESSLNRFYFDEAVRATGDQAAAHWRSCLEAGDLMAHFGLGYTLVELGRPRDAYRHLRAYAELVPSNS